MIEFIYFAIVAFILSVPLTYLAKQYALKKQLVDIPDERRNHQQITPRGGGIGFVISFLVILVAMFNYSLVTSAIFIPMFCGGIVVALLGYLDDHISIKSSLRLAMQIVTSLIILWFLPLPDSFHIIGDFHVTGWALHIGIFISIIWLINVYNFMDGIDGITSVEVISVSLIMIALLYSQDALNSESAILMLIVGATAGFLVFNWPPASIFMGDVGSCFLGFIMGMMALVLWSISDASMWAWVILQGVFVIDTVVTLLRRAARRVKVFEAHSQHAFQHAYRKHGSVLRVLASSVIIKIIWLTPFAWLVMSSILSPLLAMSIAFSPLVLIAYCYNAGIDIKTNV